MSCGRIHFDTCAGTTLDYCASIPALDVDPVIDGVIDCGLVRHDLIPVGWRGGGSGAPPLTVSATYAVAWRLDRLYLFVDVSDPDRFSRQPEFCADGVELYVDSDGTFAGQTYDDPGTRQFTVAAPADDVTTLRSGGVYVDRVRRGTWTSTRFGAFPREGGYTVEADVTAADLGLATWSLTDRIAFDLGIDVSTPDGSPGPLLSPLCPSNGDLRLGQFFARINENTSNCDNRPYCDVAAFCTPTLSP